MSKQGLLKHDKKEKDYLNYISLEVRDKLQTIKKGTVISLNTKLKAYKTNTNGWKVELGYLRGYKTKIEIWLDYYANHSERKICYSFFSSSKQQIKTIAKHGKKSIGEPRRLSDEDMITDKKTKSYMISSPLKKSEYGRPIIEMYGDEVECYYGIYEHQKNTNNKRAFNLLVKRIVEFIETLARDLPGTKHADPERDSFPKQENRKLVKTHISRERDSHLPNLRKQLDDFQCQICHMRFENVYGPLGRYFAEAHHKVPLSKLKGKVNTSVDDLTTVCANCHRMLHRLNGKPADITYLKKQFKINLQKK